MLNLNELYAKISADFWKSDQIAKWVEATFFRKKVHQQTSSGTPSGNLPIVTLSTGKIDLSFLSGTALAEYIADTVGAMFSGNIETNVTVTYQDSDNTIDVVVTTNTEEVQDIVGTMATDSSSIDFSYNDTAGTFTASVITEAIQDIVGAMGFSSGVNPVVYDGYDDASGTYTWSLQTNSITTAYLVDANVTLAKLANLDQATIIGRASAAGTGVPVALTADQLIAIANTGTTTLTPANILMDASGTVSLASGGIAFMNASGATLTAGTDSVTLNDSHFIIDGFLQLNSATATISGGVITATASNMIVDTEGAAATDDLDTINGGAEGRILYIRTTNSSRDIVLKHGTGNIRMSGGVDGTLANRRNMAYGIYNATESIWVLVLITGT